MEVSGEKFNRYFEKGDGYAREICVRGADHWFFLLISTRGVLAAGLEADMVIYNGKIVTVDSPDPENFRVVEAAANL